MALSLLDEHIKTCLFLAARDADTERQATLKQTSEAIARLVRS